MPYEPTPPVDPSIVPTNEIPTNLDLFNSSGTVNPSNTRHTVIRPPYATTTKPIRKRNILIACIQQLPVYIHNFYFWQEFLKEFGIEKKIDDQWEGLTAAIFGPLIILIMLGTTITFIASIIPAVTEDNCHPKRRINKFIENCRNLIQFEINQLNLVEGNTKEIPIYINANKIKKKFNISDNNELEKIFSWIKDDFKITVKLIRTEEEINVYIQRKNNSLTTKENFLYYHPIINQELKKRLSQSFNLVSVQKNPIFNTILNVYAEGIPTTLTFAMFLLAINKVLQEHVKPINKLPIVAAWIIRFLVLFLCGTKSFVSYKRNFKKGNIAIRSLIHYCNYARPFFRIEKNTYKKLTNDVVFPTLAAVFTYVMTTLFFFKKGFINQLIETGCELSTLCHYDFDDKNPIPNWQYYLIPFFMLNSMSTMLSMRLPTSWAEYKSSIKPKSNTSVAPTKCTPVDRQTLNDTKLMNPDNYLSWQVIKAGIAADTIQMMMQIFVGLSSVFSLTGLEQTDTIVIITSALVSFFAGRSYFHFQKNYAKGKFIFTHSSFHEAFTGLRKKLCCERHHNDEHAANTPLLADEESGHLQNN